jgi:hypothetical protein
MSGMTPEQMKETAIKNSKYVKLEDGETSHPALLMECKAVPQQRDPDKETYRYSLKFEDGSIKYLESTSTGLLRRMADVMGKKIQLTREGSGTDTRYEVFLSE